MTLDHPLNSEFQSKTQTGERIILSSRPEGRNSHGPVCSLSTAQHKHPLSETHLGHVDLIFLARFKEKELLGSVRAQSHKARNKSPGYLTPESGYFAMDSHGWLKPISKR